MQFKRLDYYLTNYKKLKLSNKLIYKNAIPIISIISPIYNREKYISRFINNIQNQNFHNIELILVDDYSRDDSVKKIESFIKKDHRIILIKNKKNKGTLITRNLGVLYSKGKYLIMADPDDIISKNILNTCYKYAEKFSYEIIRFKVYIGNGRLLFGNLFKNLDKKPIYQPKLPLYLFYGKGELEKIDGFIFNKFIKRETFIRALNLLNHFYLNKYMIFQEDLLMTFSLYSASNSIFFLNKIGYFYQSNSQSVTRNLIKELRIKSLFIQLKFVFEFYKNKKFERDIINYRFMKQNIK